MLQRPQIHEPLPASTPSKASCQILADPFVFVPITQREAAKGRGAAKRIVRAHVTRIQHAKSSTLSSTQNLQTWTVRPYIHRGLVKPPRKPHLCSTQRRLSKDEVREEEATDETESLSVSLACRLPTGKAAEDPFWSYPVDYQPHLSPIFAHYIQNIAVEIPDLDGPNDRGLLRRSWFPLAMTEAATM